MNLIKQTQSNIFVLSAVLMISIVMQLFFCAEPAPPPGGPPDKQKPFLLGSEPVNGSVSVPPGNQVTLFFSEDIIPPGSGKQLFISPRPSKDVKLKWKSDRVIIVFPDSFEVNQTYIVSASAGIGDLRGNKMDSSLVIAFSTGESIATGSVSGVCYNERGSYQGGLVVALYDFREVTGQVTMDSIYGTYLTQSTEEGQFVFNYLPDHEYLLVAFEDKNRDERLNPATEPFGIADRRVIVGSETNLEGLSLALTSQPDTTRPEIVSAAMTDNGLLRIRFAKETNLESIIADPGSVILIAIADSSMVYRGEAMLDVEVVSATTVTVCTGNPPPGAYTLRFQYDSTSKPVVFDPVLIVTKEDPTPPTILEFIPDGGRWLAENIKLSVLFSEPIDTSKLTPQTFEFLDSDNKIITLAPVWTNPLELKFKTEELEAGQTYRMAITEFEIVDIAGNTLGDSLREFSFTTISLDSLGGIAGSVEVRIAGKETDPVRLTFRNVITKQEYVTISENSQFKVEVPAGKYVADGFVDSDSDGLRGKGTLTPLQLAETMASFSDTIAVRARFESAGIELIME